MDIQEHVVGVKPSIQQLLDTLKLVLGQSGKITVTIAPDGVMPPWVKAAVVPHAGIELHMPLTMTYTLNGDTAVITFAPPNPRGFYRVIEAEVAQISVNLSQIVVTTVGLMPDLTLRVDS